MPRSSLERRQEAITIGHTEGGRRHRNENQTFGTIFQFCVSKIQHPRFGRSTAIPDRVIKRLGRLGSPPQRALCCLNPLLWARLRGELFRGTKLVQSPSTKEAGSVRKWSVRVLSAAPIMHR